MRLPLMISGLLLLAACETDGLSEPGYITPLDGQSAIPVELDLVVHTTELELPPDYPADGLIQVVDLEDGGLVEGELSYDGEELRFTPYSRWRPDRRYAWTIDPVEDIPHAPEVRIEEHLLGTAVFDTSEDLHLLAGSVREADQACLVFSRPVTADDSASFRFTVDGEDVEVALFEALPRDAWGVGYETEGTDRGVDVRCVTIEGALDPGAVLRMWWGTRGPWRVELEDDLPTVFDRLRRGGRL